MVSGRQQVRGPVVGSLPSVQSTWVGFLVPSSAWPTAGSHGQLVSEPVAGISVYLCLEIKTERKDGQGGGR